SVCYRVPWSGNGAYTFTAADLFPGGNSGGSVEGHEIAQIQMALTPNINSHASGRVTVSLNTTEEETEVPEPGTIAYALAGLGSLAGIKRRIKK
ncbi:MAG: PEP-CTERM sorting domain-containing protein, partial [Abditibacteriota bacterium]|nr:PEP-CTERM sorting domain-containing protein [Abditibacteriota bacterium]